MQYFTQVSCLSTRMETESWEFGTVLVGGDSN